MGVDTRVDYPKFCEVQRGTLTLFFLAKEKRDHDCQYGVNYLKGFGQVQSGTLTFFFLANFNEDTWSY